MRLMVLHYAIKWPQNPSTETILQPFDHVTKGTGMFPSIHCRPFSAVCCNVAWLSSELLANEALNLSSTLLSALRTRNSSASCPLPITSLHLSLRPATIPARPLPCARAAAAERGGSAGRKHRLCVAMREVSWCSRCNRAIKCENCFRRSVRPGRPSAHRPATTWAR